MTTLSRKGCEGQHDHQLTEHICGRPLGICFNEVTNELYIVDAYMGLLKVGPEGGLATSIATHAQGTLCYSPMVWTSTNSMDPFISLTAVLFIK